MNIKLWQAINMALCDSMEENDRILVIGQDVGIPGGPYGLTRGILDKFGPERIIDTPISEAAMIACGIGAAVTGLYPIVDIMFLDFIALGMNQLVNQAAKYRFFTRDPDLELPLVIHTLYGGRASMGAQHSQSLEAWLCHVPGLKVAFPSTPQDAYEVLRAAIMDPDPVVVINSITLLRQRGNLDKLAADYQVGKGRCVREGNDLTIVSYGPCVRLCEQAMSALQVNGDLIDLRWIQPWDDGLVIESVKKTSRLMVVHDGVEIGGLGGEIVARIVNSGFWYLDAPPVRVGANFSPIPVSSRDWRSLLPNLERVQSGILEVLGV